MATLASQEPDEKTAGYDFLAGELVKRDAEVERLRAALREAARRLIANGDGYGANEVTAALERKP